MKQLIMILMFLFAFTYISQAKDERIQSNGYTIIEKLCSLKPYSFTRHAVGYNIFPKIKFDYIIGAIPNNYEIGMYMSMLKIDCEFIIVGLPALKSMPSINVGTLINYARRVRKSEG